MIHAWTRRKLVFLRAKKLDISHAIECLLKHSNWVNSILTKRIEADNLSAISSKELLPNLFINETAKTILSEDKRTET